MRAVLRGLEACRSMRNTPSHSHVTRAHALLLFMEGDARGAHTLLDVRPGICWRGGDKPVTFGDPGAGHAVRLFAQRLAGHSRLWKPIPAAELSQGPTGI